ncbi:MAG: HisA/HisF-related TIM barrel protein [Pseudomonadota bacterium]|nr:HisA/HisF-related TIM barrel protein [Pseudomonadota bacterium]
MLRHRIIPLLLLKDGGLYKTTKFAKPSYVGDPINAVKIFNDKEVDELIVVDIEASRSGRPPDFAMAEWLAEECFMPLCWGGGIRDEDDAAQLFRLGIEKVSLQSAALADMSLVTRLAGRHGAQAVVVSIDVEKDWLGRYRLRGKGSRTWQDAIREAAASGAGEILLTAVEREGTRMGMDTSLIAEAAMLTDIPLIACGGAGSLADFKAATDSGASAVAAGAWFVWQGPHKAVLITYPATAEINAVWGH